MSLNKIRKRPIGTSIIKKKQFNFRLNIALFDTVSRNSLHVAQMTVAKLCKKYTKFRHRARKSGNNNVAQTTVVLQDL